jgi:uncharacterized protein (TIGR02300 family)
MTKPELGTKRLCAKCGARFYDLLHSPITCPKCATVLAAADVSPSRVRVKAAREPEPTRCRWSLRAPVRISDGCRRRSRR